MKKNLPRRFGFEKKTKVKFQQTTNMMAFKFWKLLMVIVIPSNSMKLSLGILEHIASQLTIDECRVLVSSLESHRLDNNPAVHYGRKLPLDKSCYDILLSWYNKGGHTAPFPRLHTKLIQLEHPTLANWLSEEMMVGLSSNFEDYDIVNDKEADERLQKILYDDVLSDIEASPVVPIMSDIETTTSVAEPEENEKNQVLLNCFLLLGLISLSSSVLLILAHKAYVTFQH